MKSIKVLLGTFEFVDGTAIIHRIDKEVEVLASELNDFCEKSLQIYDGYLIPSMYNGVIKNK